MLEVDSQQKVIMKFSLKDVTDPAASPLLVHQVSLKFGILWSVKGELRVATPG
jgi:hypothetical protein